MITHGAYFCNVTGAVICYNSCHQIGATAARKGDGFKSLCSSTLVISPFMDMERNSATVATVSTAMSPPREVTSVQQAYPTCNASKWIFVIGDNNRRHRRLRCSREKTQVDINRCYVMRSGGPNSPWETTSALRSLCQPYECVPVSLSKRFQLWLTSKNPRNVNERAAE